MSSALIGSSQRAVERETESVMLRVVWNHAYQKKA
jgi:hypothetical protein